VLGPTRGIPPGTIREGSEHILEAMRAHGVRRLVAVVGAGVRDANDRPGLLDKAIGALLKLTAREVYEEMRSVADRVRDSGLDWTIVRPGGLTDGPATGTYLSGTDLSIKATRVSRADVADFVLQQLLDDRYLRQTPAVS